MYDQLGLSENQAKKIVDGLYALLAGNYALALKTQSFHWNVTGPRFEPLHAFFEEQYTALTDANDEIAERIRKLGFVVNAGLGTFNDASAVKDTPVTEEGGDTQASTFLSTLLADHKAVRDAAKTTHDMAADADDQVTVDFMTERMDFHEKTMWMLRSHLV